MLPMENKKAFPWNPPKHRRPSPWISTAALGERQAGIMVTWRMDSLLVELAGTLWFGSVRGCFILGKMLTQPGCGCEVSGAKSSA